MVNPRDFQAVQRCIRLNTCLWGGRYNPIIPSFVRAPSRWHHGPWHPTASDITSGYLRFFEPDVIVEAEPGLADRVGWKPGERFSEAQRLVALDEFITTDNGGRLNFASGIDITAIHAYRYNKEFKFQLKREEKFAIMNDSSKRDAFFDVFVGIFPSDPKLTYIEEQYKTAYSPAELPHAADTFLTLMEEFYYTPDWFTRVDLEADFTGHSDLTFFVFDPSDGQDVIDAWNLRQFERNVILIHIDWFDRCAPLMRDLITKNFRPIPGNPFGTMLHATVEFSRSITQERAEQLVRDHLPDLPQGSWSFKLWYERIWENRDDAMVFRPQRVRLTAARSAIDENVSDNLHVSFKTPSPEFLDGDSWYGRTTWVNVVQPSRTYSDLDELATVYPTNTFNPKFPRLRLSEWGAISREGWVCPQRYKRMGEYLQLQLGRDAITAWFAEQKITAVPSDAGRVAEQIIRSVGNLHSCALFAEEDIVNLLDKMASTRVLHDASLGMVEESNFPDRAVPTRRWEALFARKRHTQRMPWITLEEFTKRSLLRAGLEVRCPHCAQKNWFDLTSLDYTLICIRCLKQFSFPQAGPEFKKLRWLYRVIGPFATPNFARGGYAVALALRAFAHGLGVGDRRMTWTTGQELDLGTGRVEVDFVLWYQRDSLFRESSEPEIVLGEAKSFGREVVTQDEVDHLKQVANRFPGAFIAVAVLKDTFSPREKARLVGLAKWGRRQRHNGLPINPLIIFTGTELFARWHIEQAWKDKGGKAKSLVDPAYVDISRLPTFSELTQQLYLDLPPFSADLQRSRARRQPKHSPQ
jgi:hypothetical protein